MILLKKIQLKNFLSHKDTSIDFKDGTKLLLDGMSGAGKSSIIDALIWCFYGKGRSDNRSLIKRGMAATGVMVEITDDDKEYRIERSATRSGKNSVEVAEKIDGKYVQCKITGAKATQDFLENKILKSSYLLFINSAAYPQDNQENFVKQTAEKRKDIIMEIIKAGDYDEYYDKAKGALNELDVRQSGLTAELDLHKAKIGQAEATVASIPNYEAAIAASKNEIATTQKITKDWEVVEENNKTLNLQVAELTAKRTFLTSESAKKENRLAVLNIQLKDLQSINLDELKSKVAALGSLRDQLSILEVQREAALGWDAKKAGVISSKPNFFDWQPQINKLIEKATKLSAETGRMCPAIGKECPYVGEERNKQLEEINTEISDYLTKQKTMTTAMAAYESSLAVLGERPAFDALAWNGVSSQIKELGRVDLELAGYSNLEEKIKTINDEMIELINWTNTTYPAEIASLTNTINVLESQINKDAVEMLRQCRENLTNAQLREQQNQMYLDNALAVQKESAILLEKINMISGQLDGIGTDRVALEEIKIALGNRGIKSIIIDYVIPQLEDNVNKILGKLSDFHVTLETQKEGVGGDTILEGLFITVTNGQGESFDLTNFSGGEKMRIVTAVSEGLASLQKIGFRIFDESIVGLDSATVEGFTEVLMQIQSRFSQVLCISHLQPIKDLFDEKITIVKQNGDSLIKV